MNVALSEFFQILILYYEIIFSSFTYTADGSI